MGVFNIRAGEGVNMSGLHVPVQSIHEASFGDSQGLAEVITDLLGLGFRVYRVSLRR